jgi:hypothetical protein
MNGTAVAIDDRYDPSHPRHRELMLNPPHQWYRVTWPGDSGVYPSGPQLDAQLRYLRSRGFEEGQITVKPETVKTRPPGVPNPRRTPAIRYDQWAHELGEALAKTGASHRFGDGTHDAWRMGKTPTEYATELAARQRSRKARTR